MKVVKILAIVVVTTVVTILCIRSGQAIIKAPAPAKTVYRTADDKPETGGDRGGGVPDVEDADAPEVGDHPGEPDAGRPEVSDPGGPNATEDPGVPEVSDPGGPDVGDPGMPEVGDAGTAEDAGASNQDPGDPGRLLAMTNSSMDTTIPEPENNLQATSRSLNTDPVNDGRYPVGVSKSRSRSPPIVVRGKPMKPAPPYSDKDDDGDEKNEHEGKVIVDTGVYHTENRPYYRHTDNNDYSDADADQSAVGEEDGSAGYHQQSTYGVMYNAGGGGGENPNDGTGWSPAGPPYGAVGRPAYGQPAVVQPYPTGYHHHHHQQHNFYTAKPTAPRPIPPLVGHNYYHQLHSLPPMPVPPPLATVQQTNNYLQQQQHQQQQQQLLSAAGWQQNAIGHVQSALDKIDWHKIGILAMVKLGVAKIKAFAFLKLLFLLVFKLKMFLIAMFFKFLLLLKLMKFFKLLVAKLILVTLLPLLASLFTSPMLVGGLLSIPTRILDYLTGPVYVPGSDSAAAVAATKTGTAAGTQASAATTAAVTTAKAGGGGDGSLTTVVLSDRGPDDVAAYLLDKRRLQAMELFDPALSAFRKVLDSEKCVERIACRMAVVEKAGILPVWINWMLRRVSKFIPNGKLETYLKAYDDVNNEINVKSESPDNWATWCSERYDCNTTANSTINVDTVLSLTKQY